jgi:hypothetical protein
VPKNLTKIGMLYLDELRTLLASGDELPRQELAFFFDTLSETAEAAIHLADMGDRLPVSFWRGAFPKLLSTRELELFREPQRNRLRKARFLLFRDSMQKLWPELLRQLQLTARYNALAGNWSPVFGVLPTRRLQMWCYFRKLWALGLLYRCGWNVDMTQIETLASMDSLLHKSLFFSLEGEPAD